MEHRDWASSPSSQSSYAPGPPSSTFSSYSDFPGSESFLTLPPIIQGFITNSSNPSGRSSARSHPQTALVEEDSLNPDQLPPFSELTGLREFTDSPLSLGYLPQIQDSISTQNTINLVAESEILPMAPQRASKRAAEAVSLDSPNKRSRRNIAPSIHHDADKSIEEVDLAEDEPALSDTLKKQREQQLALQEDSQKPTKLSKLTCIICLDKMTNITATSCGHIFCFECLTQAIRSQDRSHDGRRGNCPVCRQPLSLNKKHDIIPLEIMKKASVTQPTKRTKH